MLAPFSGFLGFGLNCFLGLRLVIFLPPLRVICSYSIFDLLFSRTLVSWLAPLSDRISIWILRSLVLGDSFGAGIISTSSLDESDEFEVSGMRDFFALFVSLFLESDESEFDPGLLFPLFLLVGSLEGPELSGPEGAVFCGDVGAAVSDFFFFLGLLLVGPRGFAY